MMLMGLPVHTIVPSATTAPFRYSWAVNVAVPAQEAKEASIVIVSPAKSPVRGIAMGSLFDPVMVVIP